MNLLCYRTESQLLAGHCAIAYLAERSVIIELEFNKNAFTVIKKLSRILFLSSSSSVIFLPYLGAFFYGLPVIEFAFAIRNIFTKKTVKINYYGDGFLVLGRKKHLLNSKLRNTVCAALSKVVNFSEFYFTDYNYQLNLECCSNIVKLDIDFISKQVKKNHLPNELESISNYIKLRGGIQVLPMFNTVSCRRFSERMAFEFWRDTINYISKNITENNQTLIILLHPADKLSNYIYLLKQYFGFRKDILFINMAFELFYLFLHDKISGVIGMSPGCVSFMKNLPVGEKSKLNGVVDALPHNLVETIPVDILSRLKL